MIRENKYTQLSLLSVHLARGGSAKKEGGPLEQAELQLNRPAEEPPPRYHLGQSIAWFQD